VHLQEAERIRSIMIFMIWRNLKQIVSLHMNSVRILPDSRFNGPQPSMKRQPNRRHHLKQSPSPTTLVLSPGGITLVLPFFLFFQTPRNPVARLFERQTVMVGSHNTQNKACRVGKPRPLLHASFSSRKKEAVSQVRRS
jgi:hypothetical protein